MEISTYRLARPARSFVLASFALVAMSAGAGLGCERTAASHVTRQPAMAFAVARSKQTPDDTLPKQVVEMLANSTRPEFDSAAQPAARRVLPLSAAWLVPASDDEVCLVRSVEPLVPTLRGVALQPIVSVECKPEQEAQEGHLVETQSLSVDGSTSQSDRVVGIVPDGTRRLEVTYGARGRLAIIPQRNAYEAVVPRPRAVRFVTGHEPVEEHVIPLLASDK
jgi:hypothetical protein